MISYSIGTWLFVKGLALIYVAAFASLTVQIKGLLGSGGIAPAAMFLRATRDLYGRGRFLAVPTIFWWTNSDVALKAVCGIGCAAGLALFAGVWPVLMLLVCFVCYLSLVSVGQDFLSFQWDILLIETGFLAIFLIPLKYTWGADFRLAPEPSMLALLLVWWLLFRLNFSSGVVKLASGDRSWRDLTAMMYHYETQPLPNLLAWYMNQLPRGLQKASVLFTFAAELAVPFFIFVPGPIQAVASAVLILLQVLILTTGNFGFFNYLTIVLCLPVIDDSTYGRALPGAWTRHLTMISGGSWLGENPVLIPIAALVLVVSLAWFFHMLRRRRGLSGWVLALLRFVLPFKIVNTYGLFAVMTTERPEIVIEGSDDGLAWKEYAFKWKPGRVDRAPRQVAPHQPRLDWQMWFAAMGTFESNVWLQNLFARLLQGKPEVLGLLGHNPFAEKPPRYVRALLYDYKFTDFAEKKKTGAWWKRTLLSEYSPVASIT